MTDVGKRATSSPVADGGEVSPGGTAVSRTHDAQPTNTGPRAASLEDLKKLAAKATPGPWVATRKARTRNGKPDEVWTECEDRFVAECFQGDDRGEVKGMVADAAYIAAANPSTILALIEDLEARERKAAASVALADSDNPTVKALIDRIEELEDALSIYEGRRDKAEGQTMPADLVMGDFDE